MFPTGGVVVVGVGGHLGHGMLIVGFDHLVGCLGVVASVASGATQSLERMRSVAEQRKTSRSDASNTRGSRIMGDTCIYIVTDAPHVAVSISCSNVICNLSSPVPHPCAHQRAATPNAPTDAKAGPSAQVPLLAQLPGRIPSPGSASTIRAYAGQAPPYLGRSRGPAASGRAASKGEKRAHNNWFRSRKRWRKAQRRAK